MKSWIHEIAESYVSTHKPVRRDLKENYVSLNEEQRFGLLSENVLNYLDEQLRNAYGVGVNDLTEEQLNELINALRNAGRAVKNTGKALALAGTLAGGAAGASEYNAPYSPEGAPVIQATEEGGFKKVGTVTSDNLVARGGKLVKRRDGSGNATARRVAGEDGTPEDSDGISQTHGGILPPGAAVQDHDLLTQRVLGGLNAGHNRIAKSFNPFGRKVVRQVDGTSTTEPRVGK